MCIVYLLIDVYRSYTYTMYIQWYAMIGNEYSVEGTQSKKGSRDYRLIG